MLNGQRGVAFRNVGMLFDKGVIGGLSDRQLLERFEQRDTGGSELAFASLVRRHGPMVLRVCRWVLRDPNDIDDAFQATFLVLVRRAGSLRVRDSLAPWLYQVARRTAACMRSTAARRRRHEAAASQTAHIAGDEAQPDDLAETLDHEVTRLPDRYRIVIELCLIEGLTHRQAAEHLGWPVGTVESRLARAKDRLRDRLNRRGMAPSAMMLARGLGQWGRRATSRAGRCHGPCRGAVPGGWGGCLPIGNGVGQSSTRNDSGTQDAARTGERRARRAGRGGCP